MNLNLLFVIRIQVIAILSAVSLAFYAYYYFDNFHYHVTRGYAHLGYPEAQHITGQKLLFGAFSTSISKSVCLF